MTNIKRTIAKLLIVATVASTFAITASARYYSFSFNVNTASNGGIAYSAPNPKDDNDPLAYVYTNSHNIINSDVFYYRVVATADKNREGCSNYARVTPSNVSRITMQYYSGYAWTGALRCLRADTDKYTVRASGSWYS